MSHLNPFAAFMCVTYVPVLQVSVFPVSASCLHLFIHVPEAVASMHGYEEEEHEFLSIEEMSPPEFISEKRVRVLSCCSVNLEHETCTQKLKSIRRIRKICGGSIPRSHQLCECCCLLS